MIPLHRWVPAGVVERLALGSSPTSVGEPDELVIDAVPVDGRPDWPEWLGRELRLQRSFELTP